MPSSYTRGLSRSQRRIKNIKSYVAYYEGKLFALQHCVLFRETGFSPFQVSVAFFCYGSRPTVLNTAPPVASSSAILCPCIPEWVYCSPGQLRSKLSRTKCMYRYLNVRGDRNALSCLLAV